MIALLIVCSGCSKIGRSSANNSNPLENIQSALEEVLGDNSDTENSSSAAEQAVALEDPTFTPAILTIPVLRISTNEQAVIDSTDTYVNGHLKFQSANGETLAESDLTIKGRGNSTWLMPKKPYRIKLPAKLAFQDMPADKDWVLLANYSDKSLLRTAAAFELGNRLGMAYTPRSIFVELFLNDAYQGVYQLAENIKISKSRVNIKELETSDISSAKISGGYLLEVDARMKDPFGFITSRSLTMTITKPEPPAAEQSTYIESYFNNFESLIFDDVASNSAQYQSLIDVDSFINWYLVSEIMKNNDSVDFSSIYMHKDRDKPLAMGPLWDFDIAAGNIDYSEAQYPEGWWIRTNARWFERLFQDPVFVARVKTRWYTMKVSAIDTLPSFIDLRAKELDLAQSNNFSRWTTLQAKVWPNPVVNQTYQGELDYLKAWYIKRVAWLDREINQL
ncbi:MAG: hypothetical protein EOP04_08320 [Proteobacteria bacterium]|nr:MAG: hypothetical protein EOP04_08320 [Pseudomonadota bacterium]